MIVLLPSQPHHSTRKPKQAAGFSGDLAAGEIQPLDTRTSSSSSNRSSSTSTSSGSSNYSIQDQLNNQATIASSYEPLCTPSLQAARRRSALLSLPLAQPPQDQAGGLFGWPSAKAWSASGQPPPQPLQPLQVPAERAAVAALQQQLEERMAALPTSIDTDLALLAAARNNSGGGSDATNAGASQPPPALSARHEMAVRARLEQKLIMQEAAEVLEGYERALALGR